MAKGVEQMTESANAQRGEQLIRALQHVAQEDNDPNPHADYHYDLRRQYRVKRNQRQVTDNE
jgi:hypothetical protein